MSIEGLRALIRINDSLPRSHMQGSYRVLNSGKKRLSLEKMAKSLGYFFKATAIALQVFFLFWSNFI